MSRARFYRIVRNEDRRTHPAPKWLNDDGASPEHEATFKLWAKRHRRVITWTPWGRDAFTLFAYLIGQPGSAGRQVTHEVLTELDEIARAYGAERQATINAWLTITRTFTALSARDARRIAAVNRRLLPAAANNPRPGLTTPRFDVEYPSPARSSRLKRQSRAKATE